MLLSNLAGRKTIMRELKVPASNNSTCLLCGLGAVWAAAMLERLCRNSFSTGQLARKQTAQLLRDEPELRPSEITEKEKQAALPTTIIGWSNFHWRTQCTDLIASTLCWWKWRIPSVGSSRSLEGWSSRCGGACWGLKLSNTGEKFTSQFLQTWAEQSHETIT